MTFKTKRMLIVAACAAGCVALVLCIAGRFNSEEKAGAALRIESASPSPTVEIDAAAPTSSATAASADPVGGAHSDGVKQAIQATPTKPTPPPTPDAAQAAGMQSTPVPAATLAPVATPAVNADGQVYVPGFGWVKSSGANSEGSIGDMYENGNKVGEMG